MAREKFKTTIGGQAVIEGVMMRGPKKIALSVRLKDGGIDTEVWETTPAKWYQKVPFLRGTFNFIDSMILGQKCLSLSAEKSGFDDEEEESAFEKKLREKLGKNFMNVLMVIASILGVAIAVLLFMVFPTALTKLIGRWILSPKWLTTIEGAMRIIIFICYLFLVSKFPDIKRVFEYHGAEHKSISCYESGEALTPENALKCSRLHPRCGTSFILISLVVSIILSSFISWNVIWVRVLFKLLLLPVVIGISYEVIRLAGKYDNIFTKIISFPGLQLQRITTAEPDASQIEVAIASLLAVKPDGDEDKI